MPGTSRLLILIPSLAALGLVGCHSSSAQSSRPGPPPSHWLVSHPAEHSVSLTVIASTSAHGPRLDHSDYGHLVFRIPVGNTVLVFFGNHDATHRHSLALVGRSGDPVGVPKAHLYRGLAAPHHAYFRFVTALVGTYRLASLVPGDQARGLWIGLQVVPARGVPSAILTHTHRF